MSRHLALVAIVVGAVAVGSSACASYGTLSQYPAPIGRVDDRGYRAGYDEGRDQGERDARRRAAYDYARHGEFRDADRGYRGGDRNAYRSGFRQGFMDGYRDGYRRSGPAYGSRQGAQGPWDPNAGRNDRARTRYVSPAAEHGYRDGHDQGQSDRRDRDRYDPVGARRYRSADHDYKGSYGSRDQYKREYRDAFVQGYERGYRQG
jgi:translation initiation factor 4B